jgi:glycosyltransferase involved in cell wall biosynthesis
MSVIRVLIFHGYLLAGTGSNVYNASLAQALSRLGHEVHLLCQDRDAGRLDWVDAVGTWGEGGLELAATDGPGSPGEGSITAYVPDIGGLLPVYVPDRYAGFEVKPFERLSEAELDRYLDANVAAVHEVDALIGGTDAALANHLIMGPLICARAGLRFAAKVHGSALSYTVRPHRRFLPHAREGMAAASAVLVGSRHTAESLWETLAEPGLEAKTRLGPPGVDVAEFAPLPEGADGGESLRAVARRLEGLATAAPPAPAAPDSFGRDVGAAVAALREYAEGDGPRVVFVGKLIVSKGCDLLLAAWPLVLARVPAARLLMVGFGAYAATLRELWAAICAGRLDRARAIAAAGWAPEGGPERPLPILSAFLAAPPAGWAQAAAAPGAAASVSFSGRLEHVEVAEVLAAVEAMVVPSTFPEAFGMVAAEAAAAGALPVCADHSGLAEVAAILDDGLPAEARGLTAFPLGPGAIEGIAERLVRWLALPPPLRAAASEALSATVARHWSWEGVARGVLAASAGELGGLPPVPARSAG